MTYKLKYRKTGILPIIGLLFPPTVILSCMAATATSNSGKMNDAVLAGCMLLGVFLAWQLGLLLYKRLRSFIKNGGHTTAKFEEYVAYTSNVNYPSKLRYSFQVDGVSYNAFLLESMDNFRFNSQSELIIHYDKSNPEKHYLETRKTYSYVDIGKPADKKIREKYKKKNAAILNCNTVDELYELKRGKFRLKYEALETVLWMILPTACLYLCFTRMGMDRVVALISFVFTFIMFIIFWVLRHYGRKRFYADNTQIFDMIKNGEVVKGSFVRRYEEGLFANKNNISRTQIIYEFTDHRGARHTRQTPTIIYEDIIVLLEKGDEISICYETRNPENNYWVFEVRF